jgi:hypothetical protein
MPLPEAEMFQRRREGVREWSQVVSAEGGFFPAKAAEGAPGHRGMGNDSRSMKVEVCMRTED